MRHLAFPLALVALTSCAPLLGQTSPPSQADLAATIFKKSRDAYQALNSYQDEGTYSCDWPGKLSVRFRTKMKKPDLYRISGEYESGKKYVIWCAGEDDYASGNIGPAKDEETYFSKESNAMSPPVSLTPAQLKDCAQTIIFAGSDGPSTLILGTFFGTKNCPISVPAPDERQLQDEKVSGTDCFVFTGLSKSGSVLTIWIGKSDFLIRRIKTVETIHLNIPDDVKKLEDDLRKKSSDTPIDNAPSNEIVAVENHSNITVNEPYVSADFLH